MRRDVMGGHLMEPQSIARRTERERIVTGITRAISESGCARLSIDESLKYAGVSKETFEAHFQTPGQGMVAAQDAFLERLWLEVTDACGSERPWIINLRSGLAAALAYLGEASALARVFAVEAAASSLAVSERQFAMLDRFAALLGEGRDHCPKAAELPAMTERVLVGGIASVVTAHLLSEDARALDDLEPQLVELVLTFYLGPQEARRVAHD